MPVSAIAVGAKRGPDCLSCRHFAISHRPATPYLCRRIGFASAALPALVVLRDSGDFCRGFATRDERRRVPASG